ncbi:ArgE/DapE family deacylase [bacterium]|nr:ArgE/DapE family deacylase [candidate division CSSED10-310 bacterium]
MSQEKLKAAINEYFTAHSSVIETEILRILGEMVSKRTVNVPTSKLGNFDYLTIRGEEWRVAEIVQREFDSWGIRYDVFERQKGRPNVIGYLGKGEDHSKILFIACHMDIVPPGSGWETDPFVMTRRDGFVYGRGVLDNKGPLASSLLAAKVIKDIGADESITGQLQISALADEEAGDPDGVDYGIHYLMEENLISPAYAIIPDIGENMKKIDIAEKGRMVITVRAVGKQAHGSTPHLGVNAINKMARFLAELEHHTFQYVEDPILRKPTVNVGEIHGGAASNIVPSECTCDIDCRIVPGQTPEGVRDEMKMLSLRIADDFEFSIGDASLPHAIDPDNILVKSIQANARAFGLLPEPFGLGGGTFAKGMNEHGILAVAFGPGDDTAFHMANEYVEIKQLVTFAHLICLIAADLTM